MTPRWKIRRSGPHWLVYKKQWIYDDGWLNAYVLVGEYRLWENAITHTEIR